MSVSTHKRGPKSIREKEEIVFQYPADPESDVPGVEPARERGHPTIELCFLLRLYTIPAGGSKKEFVVYCRSRSCWKRGLDSGAKECRPFFGNGPIVYTGDRNEPAHIHVEHENRVAKFWLDSVRLQNSGGFNRKEIGRLYRLVEEY
jgi:hypothetical protein